MTRKDHTEEQTIRDLRNAEVCKAAAICRDFGISQQAFYSRKTTVCGAGPERVAGTPAAAEGKPQAESAGCDLTLDKHIPRRCCQKSLKSGHAASS
jgi:hypothetical protein